MCLRCSPGLFRHGGGQPKSRSPEAAPPVAPRKARNPRPPQRAKFPLAAASEIPQSFQPPSADGGIPGCCQGSSHGPALPPGAGCGGSSSATGQIRYPVPAAGASPRPTGRNVSVIRWISVHPGGGTHRSRPTNHMGSPSGNVGRHLCVPPCGTNGHSTCAPGRMRTARCNIR